MGKPSEKQSSRRRSATHKDRGPAAKVESVLFIFGPPGPPELKKRLRNWAADHKRSESDVYYEFMTTKLAEYCAPGKDGNSHLDYLVSKTCEHPMKVHDPEITYYYDGAHRPALRLMGGSIRSRVQPGIIAYLENTDLVNVLVNALALLFLTERVDAHIVYDEPIRKSRR